MIAGIFHEGSGLGDQLHRYITTRCLAEDKSYRWGILQPQNFKGSSFMNIDIGDAIYRDRDLVSNEQFEFECNFLMYNKNFNEKKILENGVDIRSYDPEINFVEDNTIIDGCFEDEKYWGHRIKDIQEWLQVEPLEMPEDVCVIGFRGGEYYTSPDLGLPLSYYQEGINRMLKINPNMHFQVHTDDLILAKKFFPDFECIQDIGLNWRSVRYAKHLIIANSAFYIIPSLIGDAKEIIAPRYWARRNTGMWARPSCYYQDKRFMYI